MELSILELLLIVLTFLFLGIGFAMRRLRGKMEADMRKNVTPFMGLRHAMKHNVGGHKRKR
jgi:hypothetical protein